MEIELYMRWQYLYSIKFHSMILVQYSHITMYTSLQFMKILNTMNVEEDNVRNTKAYMLTFPMIQHKQITIIKYKMSIIINDSY